MNIEGFHFLYLLIPALVLGFFCGWKFFIFEKLLTMAVVYILYSQKIDSYYVGSCENMARRLIEHNDGINNKSFTHRATDWHVFFSIINLEYQQARLIETHIKKMKSRTYYQNIKKYSDISEKLKEKYSTGSFR